MKLLMLDLIDKYATISYTLVKITILLIANKWLLIDTDGGLVDSTTYPGSMALQ